LSKDLSPDKEHRSEERRGEENGPVTENSEKEMSRSVTEVERELGDILTTI